MTKIVVTGMGQISALGHDLPAFREAIVAGHCGIAPIRPELAGKLITKNAAEVRDYDPGGYFEPRVLATLDRFSQFAVIAARQAANQAGLSPDAMSAGRIGVISGTGAGGLTTLDEAYLRLYGRGARVHPMTIPRFMISAAASQVSMDLGLRGPVFSVSSACSTSNHAIGTAMMLLRAGMADAMLAGGSEASFELGPMKSWEAMRVMAPDSCRPFSHDRRGMVLGEGAGMLVLEREETARARGAEILAEIAGFGFTADAEDLVQPSAEGAAAAMRAAIVDAGLTAEGIDCVNAHGTGTVLNDVGEAQALYRALGERAGTIPVTSTKSAHGHCLGAAGALEAIASIIGLAEGFVPATLNHTGTDPDIALDIVANAPRALDYDTVLSNNLAFGGLNACVVIRRYA